MVFYVLIFKFLEETGRQENVKRKVANIPRNSSGLKFFVNVNLTCYNCSQIFEIHHIFKGFICYQ